MNTVTLTINEERNGVELRFPGPLSEIWSGVLKNKGWKFTKSHNDPRWYAKRNPDQEKFALSVQTKYNEMLQPKAPPISTPLCQTKIQSLSPKFI